VRLCQQTTGGNMRRFVLLSVAAMVVMAVVAPPTFAGGVSLGPPHRDHASDWTGVNVVDYNGSLNSSFNCGVPSADCTLSDTAPWSWKLSSGTFSCTGTLSGDIGFDGDIVISSGALSGCDLALTSLPWQGQICQHKATGEYWVRQLVNAATIDSAYESPSYGQVLASPSGLATSVPTSHPTGFLWGNPDTGAFADAAYVFFGVFRDRYHSADFDGMWSSNELLIGPANGVPCDWPDLI
jgi:hypothetical protein